MRITRSRLRMIIREELVREAESEHSHMFDFAEPESFVPEDPASMIRAQQLVQMARDKTPDELTRAGEEWMVSHQPRQWREKAYSNRTGGTTGPWGWSGTLGEGTPRRMYDISVDPSGREYVFTPVEKDVYPYMGLGMMLDWIRSEGREDFQRFLGEWSLKLELAGSDEQKMISQLEEFYNEIKTMGWGRAEEQPTEMEVAAQDIRLEREREEAAYRKLQRLFMKMRNDAEEAGRDPETIDVLIASMETDWNDFSLETKEDFVQNIQWNIPIRSWDSRGPDWPGQPPRTP